MLHDAMIERLTADAPMRLAMAAKEPSPGPWVVDVENCGNGRNVVDRDGELVLWTAVVWRAAEIVNAERAASNARLAAAAPRMLEALRTLATASGAECHHVEYQRQVQEMAAEAIAGL